MKTRYGVVIGFVLMTLLLQGVFGSAKPALTRAQSVGEVLPLVCSGSPTPTACIYGYVYVNGLPVSGANVKIDSPYGTMNVTTTNGILSGMPYFQASLSGAPLLASPGDTITITAVHNGKTASATYTVKGGGQQVDVVLVQSADEWWNTTYGYRRLIPISTSGTLGAGTIVKVDGLDLDSLVSQGKARSDHNDIRVVRRVSTNSFQEIARVYYTGWDLEFKLAATINAGTDNSYYIYYGNPNAGTPPTFSLTQGWWVDMYRDKWWTDFGGTWAYNSVMNYDNVCDPGLDHDAKIGSSFDESDKFRGRLYIPYYGTWTFRIYTNDGYHLYIDGSEVGHFDGYNGNRWVTVGSRLLKPGWHRLELRNMWVNCGAWKFHMSGPSFPDQLVPANYFQQIWDGVHTGITPGSEEARLTFNPPIVTFNHISPSSILQQDQTLLLSGTAVDNDEQGNSIAQYVWRSDQYGVLGTQAILSVNTSILTVGTHTIFFKAKDNEGVWSDEISRQINVQSSAPPNTPILSTISNNDQDGNYIVGWTAVTGATSYMLQQQLNSGIWSTIYTGSSISQNLTGRSVGSWCYRVSASNSGGSSGWSSTQCTTVLPLPPGTPVISAILNSDGDGNYDVVWTAVASATGYTLQEQINNGAWATIYTGTATSRNMINRTNGTWCYRTRADNAGGSSNWSSVACTAVNTTPTSTWTFILYLAGDTNTIDNGNVHTAMVRAIQRLEQNPNLQVKIIALLDGPNALDTYRITFSPEANYQPMGEKRVDDPATLTEFVRQSQIDFPADHYYLVIADHANGVDGIAWDTTTNPNKTALLTPNEIRQALSTITANGNQPLDIIHFDGCSFGLLENAVTVQGLADYMIISQNTGWSVFAYADYRDAVTANTSPTDLAAAIAQGYGEKALQQQLPYTISALDISVLDETITALNAFSNSLTSFASVNQTNRTLLNNIRTQSQKFDSGGEPILTINNEDKYVDLVDFAERAKLLITTHEIPSTANTLINTLTGDHPLVIYESHRSGSFDYFGSSYTWNLDGAHGISIYYPPKAAGAIYGNYTSGVTFPNFTSQTTWSGYLQSGVPPLAPGDTLPNDQPSPLTPLLLPNNLVYLPAITR